MNIEEIRKNAPDGATHYVLYKNGLSIYIKFNNDGWWSYFSKKDGVWSGNNKYLTFEYDKMQSISKLN